MPANPLQCIYCRGIFMPASEQRWSAVQCPHCSGQMKVGECTIVVDLPVGVPQPYVRVTEQEEKKAREDWKYNRWAGKMVVLGFAGIVLAGVALAVVMIPGEKQGSSKPTQILVDAEKVRAEEKWPGTPALAEKFLTVRNWREMLPLAADAARVEGVMEWYYARREFRPQAGPVTLRQFQKADAEGRALLRVEAEVPGSRPRWLLLVQENGAWKVDWEVFVNASGVRWAAFLREPAGTEIELPLLTARKPGGVGYIAKAGASPVTHDAVLLWATERQSIAAAVLPKGAPVWKDLPGIGFNSAVKAIVRVKMENPALDPPLVKLESIVQRGWVRKER